ncbi:MAG: threonine synthase, partial [Tissierellia bacterium]|nr:threonine synthase [Tissierellia bacterium]
FIPEEFPKLGDIDNLMNLSYDELSSYILNLYFDELGEDILREASKKAYDDKFPEEVVPVKMADKAAFLELYHGKTLAFKDMALSILPHLLKASLKLKKDDRKVLILVATSGDTGKAALEGFKDIEDLSIAVYFPDGGVSEVQKLQMITQRGDNTYVAAIEGNFDDAQRGVKEIFTDENYKSELEKKSYILSSANSINIGRLIPQVVYYVYGYINLIKNGSIEKSDSINIAVPTGNFGNVLAAYYAKRMGLPVNKLIIASNDNRVLTDFFDTGKYDSDRELYLTSSPSMDILVSSNLERFLYHISDSNEEKIKDAMKKLNRDKLFEWDLFSDEEFAASASEEDISKSIKKVYEDFDYIIDPHTATAYHAYEKYLEKEKDDKFTLIASTASPFKFSNKVLESLDMEVPDDEFMSLELLSKKMKAEIPLSLRELKSMPIRHKDIIKPSEMRGFIDEIVGDEND